MAFSRAKPAGWAFGEILTSAQMNTIDTNQSRAIDGNAGGTYSPSGPINIGGSGMALTGSFTAQQGTIGDLSAPDLYTNTALVEGDLTIGANGSIIVPAGCSLDVEGGATFESVQVNNDLSVTDALNVGGAVTLTGGNLQLNAGNLAVATGSITAIGGLTARADTKLGHNGTSGTVEIGQSGGTIRRPLGFSDTGAILETVLVGTDADTAITNESGAVVYIPGSTLSAQRTYSFSGPFADGRRIRVFTHSATHSVELQYGTGTIELRFASGFFWSIELTRITNVWRPTALSPFDP